MSNTEVDASGVEADKSNFKVQDIILWINPLKSAAIFLSCLTIEISLTCFSVISVLAYVGLTFLVVATSLRLYLKFSDQADSNFIQSYLEKDVVVGKDNSNDTHKFVMKIDGFILKLRSLLLIEDYFESIKLAVFLYFMTYIGAKVNFMTLCVLVTIVIFTVPKVYKAYQIELDNMYRLLKQKISAVFSRLGEKLGHLPVIGPFLRSHRD